MCKVDLHTHSIASPDGGLTAEAYKRMLASGRLHCVAVTDHNTIAFAKKLRAELGEGIIVGEEITTLEGEIIGLYLERRIAPGKSLGETVQLIKEQGGLVYVPHPFETGRKGLSATALAAIRADIDIIETRNGRAMLQQCSRTAHAWAAEHDIPGAASSDAHGERGWGHTYSGLSQLPTRDTLADLLRNAHFEGGLPSLQGMLYPAWNRLRKRSVHA